MCSFSGKMRDGRAIVVWLRRLSFRHFIVCTVGRQKHTLRQKRVTRRYRHCELLLQFRHPVAYLAKQPLRQIVSLGAFSQKLLRYYEISPKTFELQNPVCLTYKTKELTIYSRRCEMGQAVVS